MILFHGDCSEVLKQLADNSVDSIVCDPPYGISFMAKKWDYDVPKVELWQEALRVLKPGGHALIACGTRTQHRMAVNLEDAGFEIRDIVAWVYGSGFPKSLSIGKAVDKLQGNEREDFGESENNRDRTKHNYNSVGNVGSNARITKGNSEWEGWGTALKPSMELWTLCRKPLEEKSIAENVLKHGTGGINVDGCRVGMEEISVHDAPKGTFAGGEINRGSDTESYRNHTGRFPANLIHDGSDEVVSLFPNSSGGAFPKKINGTSPISFRGDEEREGRIELNDNGSAARFFYCAKASKRERNEGCEGLEEKEYKMSSTPKRQFVDGVQQDVDFVTKPLTNKNNHPTVKPVSLMRYLCRLITPPKGIVLDPFMGSGSTGIAAELEGFDFIGIEKEEEYIKIAEARIKAWKSDKQQSLLSISKQSLI